MIAEIILSVFLVLLTVALVKALMVGRIEFGSGRDGLVADRSTSPFSFWTIFLLGLAIAVLFAWLVVG